MLDTIIAVVLIVAIMVGIPVFLLWVRDRGGIVGWTIGKLLSAIALTIALAMTAWMIYLLVDPPEGFRWGPRAVVALFTLGTLYTFATRGLFNPGPGIDEVDIDFEAPELTDAVRDAHNTLPEFIEEVRGHVDQAYIKFPYETDQECVEHIWAYVHHFEDDVFNVTIANDFYSQEGEYESRIDVPLSEVEDWQIMAPDGTIRGGYSIHGAFAYLENRGIKLTKTMKRQKAQLFGVDE